ncbi:MAG: serine hydrolase domain-containing protein, partial [Pseudomonadota bacterium]
MALTTPALAQSNDALSELDETLSALIAEHPTPGMALVIVEDGEIVLQKGYGLRSIDPPLPMTDQTILSPGSLSKNLTALGVLRLVEQGKLDLNAPISQIAPQVKLDNPFDTPITLAMLLEHSAGLEGSNFAEYAFSQPGFRPADYADRMAGRVTVSWPPGYFFSYA